MPSVGNEPAIGLTGGGGGGGTSKVFSTSYTALEHVAKSYVGSNCSAGASPTENPVALLTKMTCSVS